MPETGPFTIDADWLQSRLGTPGLSIVDASWYLPAQKRDAQGGIRGRAYSRRDLLRPGRGRRPGLEPAAHAADAATFARHVGSMGISADDTIVVYDGPGMFSAPRVWWMFRVMGVFQVYVLDGGFDRWKADGRPVTAEQTKIAPNVFHVDFDASRVASLDDMKKIVATGESQIADARPAGAVRRRGAGAAGGRARRPHAGRKKPAGIHAVEGRQAAAAGRTGEALRGSRASTFRSRW